MRYFFGFLASVALIIFVFILVLRGFSGNNAPQPNRTPLTDYASTNTQVAMTIDGPVVAEPEHDAYRITVGRSETRLEALKGYEYQVAATKTYGNNQEAFYTFLRALDLAGFSKGKDASGQAKDERGVCAAGRRFVFEIVSGTSSIQRYWTTSCGDQGTFKGNTAITKQLFDRQIPGTDFSQTVNRLRL